jgi:hypothetical protein
MGRGGADSILFGEGVASSAGGASVRRGSELSNEEEITLMRRIPELAKYDVAPC